MYTSEDIKQRISFPELVDYYGYKEERHKILCPFHHEKTASFHVYENGGKCFGGCGWSGDVIQFVMDRESVYFGKALDLLAGWFGLTREVLAQKPTKTLGVSKNVRKSVQNKRVAVNKEIIDFFCNNLKNGRRGWLHEKRLLTDETIDYMRIGYRPDMDAYSIPFWKGAPGISEVDTVQFRYCPKDGRKARYIGLDKFNHPSLIGCHTKNPDFLVVMVGTLDAILANQDGIPAISPNGLTVWKHRMDELKWRVGEIKELYFVPDNTTSEIIESVRLANALGARLRYLPEMGKEGKDYTDYRLLGHSPSNFLKEVLQVSETPFITNGKHTQTVIDVLELMAEGDIEKSVELVEILKENGYKWYSVNTKLQLIASQHPEGMSGRQWESFIHKLEVAHSYEDLIQVLRDTSIEAACSRGEF